MKAISAVLLLSLTLACAPEAPPPPPPNVVLILADDLGWTGTSVQADPNNPDSKSDYYQTPNLERLAEQGLRFSDAYAPHPNCSPIHPVVAPNGSHRK